MDTKNAAGFDGQQEREAHCTSPSGCDRRATTAVHHIGSWVAVRPDHLSDGWVHEWRCDDHTVEEVLMAIHHDELMSGYAVQEES